MGTRQVAGANVLGSLLLGFFAFGSGPLVALVGGVMNHPLDPTGVIAPIR